MAHLSIETQGVNGGNPNFKKNVGKTIVTYNQNSNFISSDVFEGRGESYRRRDNEWIEICQDEKLLFCGNFGELCDILKSK